MITGLPATSASSQARFAAAALKVQRPQSQKGLKVAMAQTRSCASPAQATQNRIGSRLMGPTTDSITTLPISDGATACRMGPINGPRDS